VRRFDATATGTRLSGEVEYRVELPWRQKVLLPGVEFQARRPLHNELRRVLELVKVRVEAA